MVPDATSDVLALLHQHLTSVSSSAATVFLASVPFTHALGLYCHGARCQRVGEVLLFPLTGGNRHIVFQLLAWALWSVSVLAVLWLPSVPPTHQHVVTGATAAGSFVSELFMGMTVLVYAEPLGAGGAGGGAMSMACSPRPVQRRRQLVSPFVASALIMVMGMALAATGSLLLLAVEYLPDAPSRVLYCCMALVCLLVGASCTHGLGGHMLYRFNAAREEKMRRRAAQQQGVPRTALSVPSRTAFAILDAATAAAAAVGDICVTAASAASFSAQAVAPPSKATLPVLKVVDDAGSVIAGRTDAGGGTRGAADVLEPVEATAQGAEGAEAWLCSNGRAAGGAAAGGGPGSGCSAELEAELEPPWQFFQPFAGGTAFIATQALGWSLCGLAVVCLMALLRQLALGVAYYARVWALSAGSLMLAANLVLGASLFTFKGRRTANVLLQPLLHPRRAGRVTLGVLAPVFLMYLPVHAFFSVWALSYAFLPLRVVATTWAAILVPYYFYGLVGDPSHTGVRRWPWLCDYISSNIEQSLAFWFHSSLVVPAFKAGAFDPSRKYIFGFHPHGLYPTGAGFLPMMPSFRASTGLTRTCTLVATVLFYVPGLREIVSWSGFREVSRRSFVRALRERGSVIMCPGGQAELIYAYRAFDPKPEVVLYAGHKGFVRLAVEQGAALVPVLALGELLQLTNGCNWPSMQRYTYKRLGFPIPYLMTGRWRVSPLPMPTPLVYVVGEPLLVPYHEPGSDVDPAVVADLHRRFYLALQALFLEHQHRHPVLKDATFRLLWSDTLADAPPLR